MPCHLVHRLVGGSFDARRRSTLFIILPDRVFHARNHRVDAVFLRRVVRIFVQRAIKPDSLFEMPRPGERFIEQRFVAPIFEQDVDRAGKQAHRHQEEIVNIADQQFELQHHDVAHDPPARMGPLRPKRLTFSLCRRLAHRANVTENCHQKKIEKQ